MTLQDYTAFATSLAEASGDIIRKYYRALEDVETKSDSTLVTAADTEVERALRSMIHAHYPEHGIIGEEYGRELPEAEYQWVLDPIDGTTSFVIGRPLFGTLIALVHTGKPVLGIIDQPITRDRWIGIKEGAAFLNGKKIHARQVQKLEDVIMCTTSPDLLKDEKVRDRFNVLSSQVRSTVYGGDCYNYGLLAAGYVDVIVETGLKAHDFCALVPVIEAAGGVITDFSGAPLTLASDGNVIAAGSQKIHAQILQAVAG